MAFAARMKNYFGLAPDQNLQGFMAELKALSFADKMWFASEFRKAGIACDDPMPQP